MVDGAYITGHVGEQTATPLDSTMLHDLALELAREWGVSESDMDMYFPPDLDTARTPALIVAAADKTREKVIGVCQPSENIEVFSLGVPAQHYLINYDGKDPMEVDVSRVTIRVLNIVRPPDHGRIVMHENDPYGTGTYRADKGYFGKDRMEAIVSVGEDIVRVVVTFVVQPGAVDQLSSAKINALCPEGPSWRISGNSPSGVSYAAEPYSTPSLQARLESAGQLTFADLPGGAVGKTGGDTITLDTSAQGHGWFIDPTPGDNSEFLPTSNPNEWIAKEGSAAYGKMDLLSVLLHEYGHVLGIEHSADAHDYMATTLQPGVRRTLTVDQQLQLMALAGYFPVPDSPSQPYGPRDPGAPLPFTRTANSRFARRPRASADDLSQFATLANAKLENPDFTDGAGWATQGDVAFAAGSATLSETGAAQTRLNQVFVVGEHDRFLSFTLAGDSLGDQAGGPDDAFEVALLDANTGAALLGGNGLSRSDAFLNLQANGTERASSAVTRIANADGSRTYLVDLAAG